MIFNLADMKVTETLYMFRSVMGTSKTRKKHVRLLLSLLTWLAKAEGSLDQDKVKEIARIVKNDFGISGKELALVRKWMKATVRKRFYIQSTALRLDSILSMEEKIKTLRYVFRVAVRNGRLNKESERLIDMIAVNLFITMQTQNEIAAEFLKKPERPGRNVPVYSYLTTLGLTPAASQEEIRNAYRILVKKYHPDRFYNQEETLAELAREKFIQIDCAYKALKIS